MSPSASKYIAECSDFNLAMKVLESTFILPKKEMFARHSLATQLHQPSETKDVDLNALKLKGQSNLQAQNMTLNILSLSVVLTTRAIAN